MVDATEPTDALEAQRVLDAKSPGFSTAVELAQEPGRPADGLPEVIARTPGATVRSIGGLGQFGAVSLRGSSAQQVALFLDGVPLNDSVAGLVDLGSLPLDGLGRVEIYRGHVPVAFGGAAVGGAIDLVGAPAWQHTGMTADGGLGSFGARQARVALRGPLGRRGRSAGSLVVGHAGATGDFAFTADGNTPLVSGDDRVVYRTNNDYDRVTVHARFDHRRGPWRAFVQELLQYKDQGIPGPSSAQSRRTRMGTVLSRAVAGVRGHGLGGPGGRLEWLAGVGLVHQAFFDPEGEIGPGPDDQRLLGADLYLSPRLRLPLWRDAYLGLVADQRLEWVDVVERSPTVGSSGSARRARMAWGAGLQLEQFLFDDRWLLVPVLRVDGLDSRFAVPAGAGEQSDAGRDTATLGLAPRMGTRLRLWPGVELRASGGQYFRPPTLTELFGDRGYLVGNEGLRPEHGRSVDGGVLVDRRWPGLTTYAQLAGFGTWSTNLIQWVSAGAVARPQNVSGAWLRGLESSLAVVPDRRWLTLHANYTLLDSSNRSADPALRGRALPGRPRHELFVRTTAGRQFRTRRSTVEPRAFHTLEVITKTTLDTQERLVQPPRVLHGIGGELYLGRGVYLVVEVRNLLDVRTATVMVPIGDARAQSTAISDFIGYPLPGRSAWASLRISTAREPS
ncbi:MAG: TonB-dependent receptor [Myxococcales bacterium]|nr:TonB-dependent receptor [Myxococcales bacterium]